MNDEQRAARERGEGVTRLLIARKNSLTGIDVGWRLPLGEHSWHDLWWGNTRDATSLRSLIVDAEERLPPFEIDESVERYLHAPVTPGPEGEGGECAACPVCAAEGWAMCYCDDASLQGR